MVNDDKLVKVLVKDLVSAFMRFEADTMRRMTSQGIPVETTVRVLVLSMYECLFDAAYIKMRIIGKDAGDVGHDRAFLDEKIHQRVADEILEIMLQALKNTTSRYTWRLWLMKREKGLKE